MQESQEVVTEKMKSAKQTPAKTVCIYFAVMPLGRDMNSFLLPTQAISKQNRWSSWAFNNKPSQGLFFTACTM